MAQAENYQVPPHPPGLEMRIQLNAIVAALVSDNSGPQEPPDPYPGMMWGDTSANRLRRRNNINEGWLDIGPLDDFLGDMRSAVDGLAATYVARAGSSMTGPLTMANSAPVLFSDGTSSVWEYYAAGRIGITNAANSTWNWQMDDNGQCWWRGHINAPSMDITNRANVGDLQLIDRGSGWTANIRTRNGGGVEFVNHAYNSVLYTFDDGGTLSLVGGGRLHNDGNLWMAWYGNYLSAMHDNIINSLNTKVGQSNCNRNSGIENFGPVSSNFVMPDPWVCCGANGPGNGTANAIYLYGNVLRNF